MNGIQKYFAIILIFLIPATANAFPVMVATASQGIIVLAALLLGIGGFSSSKKLRVISLVLLSIVFYQGYRQQVINEGMGLSQEHEYFTETVRDFSNVNFMDFFDFIQVVDEDKKPEIVHLSNRGPLIYPGIYSTNSNIEDVGVNLTGKNPIYVLTVDPAAASKTVSKWSTTVDNIFLVPFSSSDIEKIITKKNNGFKVKLKKEKAPKNRETISRFYSDFNVIHIADSMGMQGSTHIDKVVLYDYNIPFYSNDFWRGISNSIDRDKDVLFITSRSNLKEGVEYVNFVSKKIGINEAIYSNVPRFWDSLSIISTDNMLTPGYRHQADFVRPSELYSLQNESDKYKVICLSSDCLKYFPEGRRVLWSYKEILLYGLDGKYSVSIPESASKDVKYVIAPMGSEESSLALKLGYRLFEGGYSFKGFTFHPSNYYGASYDIGNNEILYDHSYLSIIDQHLESIIGSISPNEPLIDSLLLLFATGLILGFMVSMNVYLKALGSILLTYVFLFFEDIVSLPVSHYQFFYVTPLILSLLFVVSSIPSINKNSALRVLISSVIIYFASQYLIMPMDRLLGAVLFSMAITSVVRVTIKALRNYDGLESVDVDRENIGSKLTKTIPLVDKKMKGYLISRIDIKTRFIGYPFSKKWILRSNHIGFEESFFSGYFDSYIIDRDKIKETVSYAYREMLTRIDSENIQFWLQPYIEGDIKGVAASHCNRDPSVMVIDYGKGDCVTSGLKSTSMKVSRFNSSEKGWVKKLVNEISKIEEMTGKAVLVEFLVSGNKLHILQVRDLPRSDYVSESEEKSWRKGVKDFYLCDESVFTDFGKRVLFRIYGKTVLTTQEGIIRRPIKLAKKLQAGSAKFALKSLSKIVESGQHTSLSVHSTLLMVEQIIKDSQITSFSDSRLDDFGLAIYREAHFFAIKNNMTLLNDLDAGSVLVKLNSTPNPLSEPTSRDLVHSIMAIAVFIIHQSAESKCVDNWRNGSVEMIDGRLIINEYESSSSISRPIKIIVEGSFDGVEVSLDEFMNLDDAGKKMAVIKSDFIPGYATEDAMKAKAIIVRWASELSHISVSCKKSGVALKVSG